MKRQNNGGKESKNTRRDVYTWGCWEVGVFCELGTAGEIKEGNKDKCVSVLCSLQGRFYVIANKQK